MWEPSELARMVMVVVVMVLLPGAGASAARPGLSWCSESERDNLRITKALKPELSHIGVVINDTYREDVVDEVFIRKQEPCRGITMEETVPIDGNRAELVMQDGEISLFWRPPDTMPIFQEVDSFCITTNPGTPQPTWDSFFARFCFPISSLQVERELQTCSNVSCVRKCCPAGMTMSGPMCVPTEDGEGWQPSLEAEEFGAEDTVHMLYGPPRRCERALNYDKFSIKPSQIEMGDLAVGIDGYCVDTFISNSSVAVALACLDKVGPAWHCIWKNLVLKPVLLAVSSVCLLMTWLVYVSVARLRNLNDGRCLLSLVSALFVAYVTLIILNMNEGVPSIGCTVAGRLCHFALLASYFWMNVLSFHNFVQLRSPMEDKWERRLVFLLYSMYAWGCPLVIVVVGVVLDTVQADAVRPHMDTDCWFLLGETPPLWAYLYGPMLVLLLINLGFFLGCTVLLSCCRRRVTFSPSSGRHQTHSAWLYVRLFIIMGILWLTEVVSWWLVPFCSTLEFVIDSINSLQGVYLFLATVCCRRNLKVFHSGRPQLIQKGRHGDVTSTPGESEMAANPLVK